MQLKAQPLKHVEWIRNLVEWQQSLVFQLGCCQIRWSLVALSLVYRWTHCQAIIHFSCTLIDVQTHTLGRNLTARILTGDLQSDILLFALHLSRSSQQLSQTRCTFFGMIVEFRSNSLAFFNSIYDNLSNKVPHATMKISRSPQGHKSGITSLINSLMFGLLILSYFLPGIDRR